MDKHFFSKDEDIITEYYRLYDEFGSTEDCCNALEELEKNIDSEKQTLWVSIFKGIKYDINGDILEEQDKHEEAKSFYSQSYFEFKNIHIPDEKSLIACFVERRKIMTLVDDDLERLKVAIEHIQNLIRKFEHFTNSMIQTEIVESKRYLSYLFLNVAEKQAQTIWSEIVNTHTKSTSLLLQISVINTMFNQAEFMHQKANSNKKTEKKYLEEAISIFTQIIDDYEGYTKNFQIEKKIATAIKNKGYLLYEINKYNEAIVLLESLTNKYENTQVNYYASLVCEALECIVKNYIMQSKFANCGGKDNLEKAIKTLDKIITFKKFKHLKNKVIRALEEKANVIEEFYLFTGLYRSDDAIDTYTELIELCRDDDNFREEWYNALHKKGELLLKQVKQENYSTEKTQLLLKIYEDQIDMVEKTNYKICGECDACMIGQIKTSFPIWNKAELLFNMKQYKNAIKDYDKMIEDCEKFNDNEISRVLIKQLQFMKGLAIFNNSSELSAKENYEDAIKGFESVINLLDSEEYMDDENTQKVLEFAKKQKKDIEEVLLPIREITKLFPQNKQNIDYLVQSVKKGKIIPVIGAGLSNFNGGYPLWKEFLNTIYNTNKKIIPINKQGFSEMTCKEQADIICKYLGIDAFREQVRRAFAKKELPKSVKNEAIGLIPQLFSEHLIMTTNLDLVIESVYGLNGNPIKSYTRKDIKSIRKSSTNNSSILYKLHGSIEDIEEAVFTSKEFDDCYKEGENNYNILHEKMQNNDRLFLGCNLQEGNEILRFCEGGGTNYAIYPYKKDNLRTVSQTLGDQKISSPILYPINNGNDHSYLKIILDYVALQVSPASADLQF